MDIIVLIIILITCIMFSAIFSSAETAFMSLSRIKLKELQEKKAWNAYSIGILKQDVQKLLITILIGNNVVNILASALATQLALTLFGDTGVGIAVGSMTLAILIFGEILPKSFAVHHASSICQLTSPILIVLQTIGKP